MTWWAWLIVGAVVGGGIVGVVWLWRERSRTLGAEGERLAREHRRTAGELADARIEDSRSEGVQALADAGARAEKEAQANAGDLADTVNRLP